MHEYGTFENKNKIFGPCEQWLHLDVAELHLGEPEGGLSCPSTSLRRGSLRCGEAAFAAARQPSLRRGSLRCGEAAFAAARQPSLRRRPDFLPSFSSLLILLFSPKITQKLKTNHGKLSQRHFNIILNQP